MCYLVRYGLSIFTRKVWTKRKVKPPLPPIQMNERDSGHPDCPARYCLADFTEDVYGEKEKDPKPQKKTINKVLPVGSISL